MIKTMFMLATGLAAVAAQAQPLADGGRPGLPVAGQHEGRAVTFRPVYYPAESFARPGVPLAPAAQTPSAPPPVPVASAPPAPAAMAAHAPIDHGYQAYAPLAYAPQAYAPPAYVPVPVPVAAAPVGWNAWGPAPGWNGGWGWAPGWNRGWNRGWGRQGWNRGWGCRSSGTGALVGTIAGATLGYGLSDPWNRSTGTVIGGLLGAVTGTAIERNQRCRW